MNKLTLILVSLISTILVGCTSENITGNKISSILPYSNSYNSTTSRSELENKSISLSLCYSDTQNESSNDIYNIKWTNSSDGWTTDKDVSLKMDKEKIKFYAYSPYIDNLNITSIVDMQTVPYSVSEDQTNTDNFRKSDLVVCIKENSIKEITDNGLTLPFLHKLSLLDIILNFKGSYQGEKSVSNLKINAFADFTFNATSTDKIVLSQESKKEILPHVENVNSEYSAILPPQDMSNCDFISLIIDGKAYKYTLSSADKISLMENKITKLNLSVGNTDITLGGITIEDWNQKTLSIKKEGGSWLDFASENAPSKDGDYYLIKSGEDLAWIAKKLNTTNETDATDKIYIKLNNDIDLSEHDWIPFTINNDDYSIFDGNNKKITGMNIKASDDKIYRGLLGFANKLKLKDLTLVNPQLIAANNSVGTSNEIMGILAGKMSSSFISNVHITNASFSPSKAGTSGGIVGVLNLGSALYASSFDGTINVDPSYDSKTVRIGGFCGTIGTAVILGCYSSGEIINSLNSGFINAFVGAGVDLPKFKLYLDACYTTAKLNNVTGKIYVSVKPEIGANACINDATLTAPENINTLNDYIKSVFSSYDLSISGGAAKTLKLKDNVDYYIYQENTDATTKDKYPYVMVKSTF